MARQDRTVSQDAGLAAKRAAEQGITPEELAQQTINAAENKYKREALNGAFRSLPEADQIAALLSVRNADHPNGVDPLGTQV